MQANNNNNVINDLVLRYEDGVDYKTFMQLESEDLLYVSNIHEEECEVLVYSTQVAEEVIVVPSQQQLEVADFFACEVVRVKLVTVSVELSEESPIYTADVVDVVYNGDEKTIVEVKIHRASRTNMFWCVPMTVYPFSFDDNGYCKIYTIGNRPEANTYGIKFVKDAQPHVVNGFLHVDPYVVKEAGKRFGHLQMIHCGRSYDLRVSVKVSNDECSDATLLWYTKLGRVEFLHDGIVEVPHIPTPEQCGYSGELDEDGNPIGEPLEWEDIAP